MEQPDLKISVAPTQVASETGRPELDNNATSPNDLLVSFVPETLDRDNVGDYQGLTSLLLERLKIERVIYIDDIYSRPVDSEAVTAFIGVLTPEHFATVEEFSHIDFTGDRDIASEDVREVLEKLDGPRQLNIFKNLAQMAGSIEDLSAQQLDARAAGIVEQLFAGTEFHGLSPDTWEEKYEEFLPEGPVAPKTLYLVDQDLRDANGKYAKETGGIDLLRDSISRSGDSEYTTVFGLLSHTFKTVEEYARWGKFADDNELASEQNKCLPVSKERLRGDIHGFLGSIKLAALNAPFADLRAEARQISKDAYDAAKAKIDSLNIWDFEHIVFQSSLNEGVWEPDTLFRLLGLYQRKEARRRAKDNAVIRGVLNIIRPVSGIENLSPTKPTQEAWRVSHDELYEEGDYLNGYSIPLELGDIFMRTGARQGEEKYFILIGQPCDLMMRLDGRGSLKNRSPVPEAVLAEISPPQVEIKNPEVAEPPEHSFELEYFDPNIFGKRYVLLRKVHTIKLWVLDLCVFNKQGLAQYRVGQKCPGAAIETWRAYFTRLSPQLDEMIDTYVELTQLLEVAKASPTEYPRLTEANAPSLLASFSASNDAFLKPDINIGTKQLNYRLKRVKRLAESRALALMAEYASRISTPGFEHDFSKDLSKPQPQAKVPSN